MEPISSFQNILIKQVQKLEKNRERRKQNMALVEGIRECQLAIVAGHTVQKLLFCSAYISEIELRAKLGAMPDTPLIDVSPQVFDSMVYRKGVANVLGIIHPNNCHFEAIDVSKKLLLLIIDSVEKPGNLGAMLRTCDAAGVDAIVVCDPQTDIYNPNCIRASLGAVFTKKIIVTNAEECITWLGANNISTFVTYLDSATPYTSQNYTSSSAIVVGSEANGIKECWLKNKFQNIIIPQYGQVDSMNVANSAAIIIYEALRQRTYKPVIS